MSKEPEEEIGYDTKTVTIDGKATNWSLLSMLSSVIFSVMKHRHYGWSFITMAYREKDDHSKITLYFGKERPGQTPTPQADPLDLKRIPQ